MADVSLPTALPGVMVGLFKEADGTYSHATRGAGGAIGSAGTARNTTAGASSTSLMAANPLRSKLFIKNDAAVDVWINFGGTAAATAGGGNFKIAANGGYFELDGYTGAVNIIAASATAAITAREF